MILKILKTQLIVAILVQINQRMHLGKCFNLNYRRKEDTEINIKKSFSMDIFKDVNMHKSLK